MELNPKDLHYKDCYKLLIGSVLPRPIAWVSTKGSNGVYNVAPFSFFTVVCPNPPTITFCPNIRSLNGIEKDTLRNIRETGEFVVNIVTETLAQAMNITSTELPADVSEFERANLTPAPSKLIDAPRITESPINFECKLSQIVTIGESLGQGSLIIGEVVYFHIADHVYTADYKIDIEQLAPIARLSGMGYTRTTDRFEMHRPPEEITSSKTMKS